MHWLQIYSAALLLIAIIYEVDAKKGISLHHTKGKSFFRGNICQNGGSCMMRSARYGICLRCKCPAGISGRYCENVIDPCTPLPCENDGTCTSCSTTFHCQCPDGFIGRRCEVKKSCGKRNVCQNGGSCIGSEGHGVCERCECPAGISGRYCEMIIDHCSHSPCKHNGTCRSGLTTFSCHCPDGFTGNTCEVIDHCASSPCENNGTCTFDTTTFSCQCAHGFLGNTCEAIDHCATSPCKNNGTCTSGSTTFSCQCAHGFMGYACEDIDYCAASPCKNNGTCSSVQTTFKCQCRDDFIGDTCEDLNYCFSSPCKNGGNCTSNPASFSCQCVGGYIGDTCEEGPFKSCMEILQNVTSTRGQEGKYPIIVDGQLKIVYCDMTTYGGGWTAIQRRKDGTTTFDRLWAEYKRGFGDPPKNYWIGNDAIHSMTKANDQELLVKLVGFNGDRIYARYSTFYIGSETTKYRLTVAGYSGTAGDALHRYHNGRQFTTRDQEHDSWGHSNCAAALKGGFWYSFCGHTSPNGGYPTRAYYDGEHMFWLPWKFENLRETEFMIRTKRVE